MIAIMRCRFQSLDLRDISMRAKKAPILDNKNEPADALRVLEAIAGRLGEGPAVPRDMITVVARAGGNPVATLLARRSPRTLSVGTGCLAFAEHDITRRAP